MAWRHLVCLSLALMSGCASATGDTSRTRPTGAQPDALCDLARSWNTAKPSSAHQITPDVDEDGDGRHYHFNLSGRAGLRTLDANCGWGSYAECNFKAIKTDGGQYQFSDLSTFGLWESRGSLFLLYRIIDPKDAAAAAKRRLVKVGDPPAEVCNQIGDYSDLM